MKRNCRDCCYPEFFNSEACGCCEGIEILTPLSTSNRPGLSKLAYRIGTHASFLETMKARLSSSDFPQLTGLTTRDAEDPSIALLDGWAAVADVLTFYQERIANEGYLRCATERRSILELARLVGYKLRPGVSSSVFLAYTIDENMKEETTIHVGSRAQSVPGPDELPQSFETSEDLKARWKWNNLKPRRTQPQTEATIKNKEFNPNSTVHGPRVYLKGINTNLKPNDPLLIELGGDKPTFSRVIDVFPDAIADRTLVTLLLNGESGSVLEPFSTEKIIEDVQLIKDLIKDLTKRPSIQRRNSFQLNRTLGDQFMSKASTGYNVVGAFAPPLRDTLTTAVANAKVTPDVGIKIYALRVEAPLFGHNVLKQTRIKEDGEIEIIGDWPIIEDVPDFSNPTTHVRSIRIGHEEENLIYLDSRRDKIINGSWIVIETPDTTRLTNKKEIIIKVNDIDTSLFRSKYGITAPTTQIRLGDEKWIEMKDSNSKLKDPSLPNGDDFNAVRGTTVYAQSEELEIAEEPIEGSICGGADQLIELDGFYEGLESGRWVIISGEREIEGTSGVRFSELAMLSSVTQDVTTVSHVAPTGNGVVEMQRPGEKIHTFIKLAEELAYCFKRDTVTIYGNVVKATNGETRQEVVGSGDGSKALQSFDLKQKPLTHVSASTPTGVDSTLNVFVNDIRWHETDTLADRQSTDRNFITQTDDEDKTSIIFANGKNGARLPTGIENIKAEYRSGIGKPGNVRAGQISLLQSKPLGVKEVINPLRASGGANREERDQARKNAPLTIKALDRLVSVQDYEDFSRTYAGIGKARAAELTDGRRQLVHVTIAGAEDIPIDETSDLFQNLRKALHDFGDPHQQIQLAIRELMLIVISARVRILPDYQWEPVVSQLRETLLDAFSFERRELGQDVLPSEVISVMQTVRGVAYVDVDTFGGIPEKESMKKDNMKSDDIAFERRLLTPEEVIQKVQAVVSVSESPNQPVQPLRVNLAKLEDGVIRPAQLAFLTPEVPDTLILNQIK